MDLPPHIGGVGAKGASSRDKDFTEYIYPATMHQTLLFFTKKGMIKKSDWSEYEQRKNAFQALKLNDEDELLNVEEETSDCDTIIIITKEGIYLNALKDDVPTQGRISAGVRGIMLREGDSVVFMQQINDEGEIVIATDEGRFKRVIVSHMEPSKRYRKGATAVALKEGAFVLSASHVTAPYKLAIVDNTQTVSEVSSEKAALLAASVRGRPIFGYKEGTVEKVIPLPYKKDE